MFFSIFHTSLRGQGGQDRADYRDGVLSITLPKTDEAKSRRIHVKAQYVLGPL